MILNVNVHFVAHFLTARESGNANRDPVRGSNFQKRLGSSWFETDIAKGAASSKSDFDFWTVASQFDGAKNVAPLAQKLLTCYSAMGDVERCHKLTYRHQTKYSNNARPINEGIYF